jgi:hypothetical protein
VHFAAAGCCGGPWCQPCAQGHHRPTRSRPRHGHTGETVKGWWWWCRESTALKGVVCAVNMRQGGGWMVGMRAASFAWFVLSSQCLVCTYALRQTIRRRLGHGRARGPYSHSCAAAAAAASAAVRSVVRMSSPSTVSRWLRASWCPWGGQWRRNWSSGETR